MGIPIAAGTTLDPAALDALRHTVRGAVLLPGDTDYETSRRAWNTAVDQHPALIVDRRRTVRRRDPLRNPSWRRCVRTRQAARG